MAGENKELRLFNVSLDVFEYEIKCPAFHMLLSLVKIVSYFGMTHDHTIGRDGDSCLLC